MSQIFGQKKGKKEKIKEMIRRLHQGAKIEELKEEFKDVLEGMGAEDISRIEEELIKEGMPAEEIRRLCDLHLAVFKESLEKEKPLAPAGHPVNILMEEHKILLQFAAMLRVTAEKLALVKDLAAAQEEMAHLNHLVEHFKESESHYLREENVLFPYLEKHGITQPPAIMWAEHNEIRKIKKGIYEVVEQHKNLSPDEFRKRLMDGAQSLANMLNSHFYKENNVLFPTSLRVISEEEWGEIRRQFDELGYCCFTPEIVVEKRGEKKEEKGEEIIPPRPTVPGKIPLETGDFTLEELEALLKTLPVDITFVDKNDTVRYFSETKERIFPRTKAVIGRKVQLCHPQQSLHKVEQILNEFKNGKREVAEFWINLRERLIHIRYFPVRDKNGAYLGCLEVTQDITEIKKIEGEKRLLD